MSVSIARNAPVIPGRFALGRFGEPRPEWLAFSLRLKIISLQPGAMILNKTVLNERLKLTAGCFNTVAAAFLTTGVLAPILTIIYGLAPKTLDPALVVVSSLICMLASGGLHLAGKSIRGGLQE